MLPCRATMIRAPSRGDRPGPAASGTIVGMVVLPPPEVPYGATAIRPAWADLPPEPRAAIAARLGSPVVWASTATGGFTSGFAAVLDTAAGERVFVKAARLVDQRHLCDWYAHEALVTAALPAEVPAPRPRWTLTVGGYFVICLEAVPDARVPVIPWHPAELTAALDAWATSAAALADPPAALVELNLPTVAMLARNDLSWWREIVDGRTPLPAPAAVVRDHVTALAALEAELPRLAGDARGLTHCDLRVDNILITPDGRATLCDWNWICHGPAWFDTGALLISAYASGLDADGLWSSHPTSAGAPSLALDATLAALSGYFLVRATAEPSDASPHLRAHQRWHGEAALTWLRHRQGWM